MATDNREDGFGSRQRGEETSRLETRLDAESSQAEFGSSVMEGMHTPLLTPVRPAYCTYGRTACGHRMHPRHRAAGPGAGALQVRYLARHTHTRALAARQALDSSPTPGLAHAS